jgi:hypothetical protein
VSDDIARLRCMWERQEGSMRKVPGVTSEAIESARGQIADIPLYNDYNPFPQPAVLPLGFIEIPSKWYGTVVDEIAIVEDHDPGDEDPSSARHVEIVTLWRRAEERPG